MKDDNIIQQKSFAFALRIVKLYKYLTEQRKEYVLSDQIIHSGTSIGANIEEAIGGQSDKDFVAKMSLAYKETRETRYWLRLLHGSDYLNDIEFTSMTADCEELLKLSGSIIKTKKSKKKPRKKKTDTNNS